MSFLSPSKPRPVAVPTPQKTEAEVRKEVKEEEADLREEEAKKARKRKGRSRTFGPGGPASTLVLFDASQKSAKL